MAKATIEVSLTETRQFRRLVRFVSEVEEHAEASDDADLGELIRLLHDDLLGDLLP